MDSSDPSKDPAKISDSRKTIYYVGMGMSGLGLLLFFSTFLSAALNFGNFNNFEARGKSMALRAFGGMALIIAGGVVSTVGARGMAGSGLMLDPEKARKDIKPWSRLSGEVFKDQLEGAGVDLGKVVDRFTEGPGESPAEELPFDEKLRRLHALYQDGILSEEEYLREKQELLDSN